VTVFRKAHLLPWLWLLPALVFAAVFLVYPILDTLRISFMGSDATGFEGLGNYRHAFDDRASRAALLNNVLWLALFTALTAGMGLLMALLSGRVRYEAAVKAAVFVPMAISFVAAAVIWRFVYTYRPEGFAQVGLLNAVGTGAGLEPVAWLVERKLPFSGLLLPSPLHTNNFALIAVGVWMWTGFAMVVFSAGLKGISTEVIDAARVDGAGEWQIFRHITLPLLKPTIAVVVTTLVIQALKKFDIVWVMTAGNFGTDVIATRWFKEMFNYRHFGRAAALAVLLMAVITPFMVFAVRRFLGEAGEVRRGGGEE